jgi:hypothetical protein
MKQYELWMGMESNLYNPRQERQRVSILQYTLVYEQSYDLVDNPYKMSLNTWGVVLLFLSIPLAVHVRK